MADTIQEICFSGPDLEANYPTVLSNHLPPLTTLTSHDPTCHSCPLTSTSLQQAISPRDGIEGLLQTAELLIAHTFETVGSEYQELALGYSRWIGDSSEPGLRKQREDRVECYFGH